MTYDARMIANYFIDLSVVDGEPITPLKLQKLIFFAHGWYLAINGSPLIADKVEAWQYGPVVPSVYGSYRGNEPITSPVQEFKIVDGKIIVSTPELPAGKEHQPVRDLLKRIWEVYKNFSAIQLSNMTHTPDSPWAKIVAPYKETGNIPFHLEIPNHIIRDYFVYKSKQS